MSRKPRPVKKGEAGWLYYPNFREYEALKARLRNAAKVSVLSIGLSACGGAAAIVGDGNEYTPPDGQLSLDAFGLYEEDSPDSSSDSNVQPGDGANEGEADAQTRPKLDASDGASEEDADEYIPPAGGGPLAGIALPGDTGCCSSPYGN